MTPPFRHAGILVLALAATAVLGSCASKPDAGWTPLWHSSWELLQSEELWLRGVPLEDARTVVVTGEHALHFRARLANRGDRPQEVVLDGPSGDRRWTLGPGADRSVDVPLSPGRYRIEGGPGVVVGEPRLGLPLEAPRLVVLALADTLRADHVTPALTPGILSVFADGRRWTDASANAPWTLPSVASLFTSRSVFDLSSPDGNLIAVPQGVPTWAERLEEAGFIGGAAVANFSIHAQNGFARGFASYRVPPAAGGGPRQRDVSWVVAEARRFLAAHQGEDAFLYLHFMDPHEPFRDHGQGLPPPPPMTPLGLRERPATEEERDVIRSLYQGEVRHLDRGLAPFLAELPHDATLAFVSDHGEVLGEHGVWGHALTLFQEVVAVPLLLRGPGIEAGKVGDPVQLLDLTPTLLRALGVEPADGMTGRFLLAPEVLGAGREPILTATFAAGPLRWAWRSHRRKLVWHGAPQPDGAPGAKTVRETNPLPRGALVYTLPGAEEGATPPRLEEALQMARLFAHSAGKMVPGATLLIAGISGPAEVSFDATGKLEPVQVWGASRVEVELRGSRWTVRTSDAYPLAGVAFQGAMDSKITLGPSTVAWPGSSVGRSLVGLSGDQRLPSLRSPGAYLWRNGERILEISGQEETEMRLRALGYL